MRLLRQRLMMLLLGELRPSLTLLCQELRTCTGA
jgi:hypothetical protein